MNYKILCSFLMVLLWPKSFLCASLKNQNEFESWQIKDYNGLKQKELWYHDAQRALHKRLALNLNKNLAKNVIFFVGDGMSIPTISAARIYDGQRNGIIGERNRLSFEHFPYVGLSKTYCSNARVADSACSATAYLCGVKANLETIGVTSNVTVFDCEAEQNKLNHLKSIVEWAQDAGKSAGIVTNTRVTHATPAGTYAHTSFRNYEADSDISEDKRTICRDIAKQMIENNGPRRFNVILGGGRQKFLPIGYKNGTRNDGRNLIEEWCGIEGGKREYVDSKEQLLNLNFQEIDHLLGLFNDDHLEYHFNNKSNEPSLVEMTEMAIKILKKNEKGFFLFVEGGKIDIAHHAAKVVTALDETLELSRAIQHAIKTTDPKETLIVVTADHSHTMSINGYSAIETSITGLSNEKASDGLPYATLSYANGPGFSRFLKTLGTSKVGREDLQTMNDIGDYNFQYPGAVWITDETHGGDDVAVYANGPWAHLFSGVMEENSLPTFMGFAACIGPGGHACDYYNE